MRGVGLMDFGGPEVLQIVDLPEVHAGPGEVRIRVHAATVNPTDTGLRGGGRAEAMRKDPPPYVPGMDAAGVIDEVAIFNAVLEEEDIQAIMEQGLEEALGLTAVDLSGKLSTTWADVKIRY